LNVLKKKGYRREKKKPANAKDQSKKKLVIKQQKEVEID